MQMQTTHNDPPQYLKELVEDAANLKAVQWIIPDCGLSAAYRFSVQLENNSKVFVKAATDEATEKWLRNEYFVLSTFKEAFMPAVIGWISNAGNYPVLITQDLSDAYWPASHNGVAWRKNDFDLLLDTVQNLSRIKGHPGLSNLKNNNANVWSKIAGNPTGFLKLGICSENWLNNSVMHLIHAENSLDNTGNTLVHGDIRSDNICIDEQNKIILVDWSHAVNGSATHDLANLLPTLYLEGGPDPYQIMPGAADHAASLCATHIQRLSTGSSMPLWLKAVFKKLIAIELEWAARCLNLDHPDGLSWKEVN
jgi:hypothetical protein